MSRYPSAPQVLVAIAALAVVAAAIAWLPSDDQGSDGLEIATADASTVAPYNGTGDAAPAQAAEPAAEPEVQSVALPVSRDGAAAPVSVNTAAPADAAPADGAAPVDTAAPAAAAPADTAAPADGAAPADTAAPADNAAPANPAPANDPAPQPKPQNNDRGYVSRAAQEGYDIHDFVEHTVDLLGAQAMEPGQARDGGYERVGPDEIRAWSPITGQRPVIEQAIDDVLERSPGASGESLERKVAKRLTELNDWKNLNRQTKENMMIITGVDIADMNKRLREDTINHLLHSPLPFGYIEEVLSPDTTIDMGYTHTLDKDWTEAAHLGDGVFQIWMVSNNNNGSHTGHVLGSFRVQLTPTTSLAEARDIGNDMVRNKNKNNKLYLAEAARRVLNGQTPRLDFSHLTEEEKRSIYDGRRLGEPTPPPIDPLAPPAQPEPEPTTTETTAEPQPQPDPPAPEPDPAADTSTPPASEPEQEAAPPAADPDPEPEPAPPAPDPDPDSQTAEPPDASGG